MNAQWIWSGEEAGYDDYREARHEFTLTDEQLTQVGRGGRIELSITADALYQVWINGQMLGHGPAKSAKGTRGVDAYDLASQVAPGRNRLDVLVLNLGAGNMCYCMDKPGLRFQIRLDDDVLAASGPETLMRVSRSHDKLTVRRWMLPCIEDVDAAAPAVEWAPASVVERDLVLYPRRVPLPTREPLTVRRIVAADGVKLPTFAISFRHKPYLVSPEELPRNNEFNTPAYLVTDIVSPVEQTLRFTPTRGAFDWYFKGRKLIEGSGWTHWEEKGEAVTIKLAAGANRLVGVHKNDRYADMSLAGFCESPVEFSNPFGAGGFQIVPLDEPVTDPALADTDWEALRSAMPAMDPAHTMPDANGQDLALGAKVIDSRADLEALLRTPAGAPLILSPAPEGEAVRVVVDLGMVHNGWLAFEVNGRAGSRLLFSCFEGIEEGPPLRLHWAYGAENALTYRLADGSQRFESFHPYGVRYIAIHHTGAEPVSLSNLRVLTANCGSQPLGFLRCSDPLLNEIYEIATQSVISSVDDTFTDCPTFEQVNWNYDNRAAFLGEILTCANTAVARHSIALFAEDPEFTGLVRSQYPSTWDSFIPLWSLHWVMWCRDYVELTGDLAFGGQMFPRIRAGVEEALGKIGARGLFEWDGVWHFVEWGHGRDDGQAISGHEQAGLAGTLEAAVRMAQLLGEADATAWDEARTALITAINRELWNEARGAYADSLHADGSLSTVSSQTTNAMMGIYGVADEAPARALAQRIADNDPALLAYGSPYGLYYVLELFDRFEMVEPIFAAIRHRWGDMVLAGDRTTWETFAEYGGYGGFPTRSRCHPFAAYVVKYLVKYLLGVSSWSCGEGPVAGKPNPPSGVTFARGAVPGPEGLFRVGWDARNSAAELSKQAKRELCATVKGEKTCTQPETWKPVAYAAEAPERSVTLDGGPFREAFERNLGYLAEWFEKTDRGSQPEDDKNWWETCLSASSEGRMLGVAGHSLRWGERAEVRDVLDTLIDRIKARQTPDGYCLPYPEEELRPNTNGAKDERRNYDRVNLTRGLAAAGMVGNADALDLLRRFYDWFNISPYLPYTLAGYFDASPDVENSWVWPGEMGTAHNGSNGLEGHVLAHLSPVGHPDDLMAALRYLVQDWFLEASARREPLSLSHFPCHVAHSYVLLAYLFWLDMYRATGERKFLDGALGAWDIVHDHFLHIGGSLAICEHTQGAYPPDSYYLRVDHKHHTGETCGSVFWAEINHRLLQLYPHDVRYADEIEQAIYNVILANQDVRGYIRYHARLQGEKDTARSINTCCEVMGTPFIARLPQYLYSVTDDGLYVNLFAPSTIDWEQAGSPVRLRCTTKFPFGPQVGLRVETTPPTAWKLRIRVPGWGAEAMPCQINGEPAGSGEPGTFMVLDRVWLAGDTVTFTVPMAWRTVRYHGADEDPEHPRYALMRGPVLMALAGADDLPLAPNQLLDRLREDAPLQCRVEGIDDARYLPYWQVEGETFTCLPTVKG